MRAFLALPIPENTVAALIAVQGRVPVGRPVPEDNLHLTLAFLGDVGEAVLEALDDVLSATPLPTAHVAFGGLGTFGDMERGLVFAEVLADPGLTALQAKVAQVARMAGAELPRRRFRPHVTLVARQPAAHGACARPAGGRPRPRSTSRLRGGRIGPLSVDADPDGARHDPLAHYPLSPIAA
jgi:2'-5' RNA ligase